MMMAADVRATVSVTQYLIPGVSLSFDTPWFGSYMSFGACCYARCSGQIRYSLLLSRYVPVLPLFTQLAVHAGPWQMLPPLLKPSMLLG